MDPPLKSPPIGRLIGDAGRLRSAVGMPYSAEAAALLEHCQASEPGHAFSPADLKALWPAFREGYTLEQLQLVWDHHNTAGVQSTELARSSGWSTRWASLAKAKLPDRVRDAERWNRSGRPTDDGTTTAGDDLITRRRKRRSQRGQ